ncbi:MAG TPA: SPOR domain-containing protein [Steroidobacteraceae bacterium]|nr:SPOR domain-containing protein [Steroidobacteraceae bacterium]
MRASTRRLARWGAALLFGASRVHAQSGAPLIEAVDSSEAGRNVNVYTKLRCGARLISQRPQDSGSSVTLRLRLGADCGVSDALAMGERAPTGGGSPIVRSVHLEHTAPGEAELTIEWSGEHRFVVTPTIDGRGVRLRILDALAGPQAAVTIRPLDEATSGYAVNLDSSTTPFEPAAIEAASAALKTPVHVSSVDLNGQTWYRLRAGPIDSRADARRLLAVAKQDYPRAWLAVADEAAAPEVILPPSADLQPARIIDPPLPAAELTGLMREAQRAMSQKNYPRATELLTKLTRQPEFDGRARAQEMLGLARERSGQLAHAKAEYEEYLRRYPEGDAAGRVRARLRTLSSASRVGKRGGLFSDDAAENAWRLDGGASQLYRLERSSLEAGGQTNEQDDQNAVYTNADLIARRRGERFDMVSRVSAGYAHDLLSDGPGNETRVSAAFFELNDRELGLATRIGRQSRNFSGLLGTFDGLFTSYQWRPRMALTAAAGFPVESTTDSPETGRRFFGLSAEFGPFRDELDLGVFAVMQQIAGVTDRQAVGLEARYFVPGRTLLAMFDYDIHYQEINSATLTGSLQLPARWSVSFSADHRRAPVLTTRNALIGQPVRDIGALLDLFTPSEIEQLARDRTPVSDLFSVSVSRPLGERFQFDFEAYATQFAATVASGDVVATPASGLEKTFQVQLSANSLAHANDLWAFTARYQDGTLTTIESLALGARLPVGGAWRLGPRLRADRRESLLDDSRETIYVPTLRLDYLRNHAWFECELGAEYGDRTLTADQEKSTRYYFGLGYRLNF